MRSKGSCEMSRKLKTFIFWLWLWPEIFVFPYRYLFLVTQLRSRALMAQRTQIHIAHLLYVFSIIYVCTFNIPSKISRVKILHQHFVFRCFNIPFLYSGTSCTSYRLASHCKFFCFDDYGSDRYNSNLRHHRHFTRTKVSAVVVGKCIGIPTVRA
jgi:hypothetical protein